MTWTDEPSTHLSSACLPQGPHFVPPQLFLSARPTNRQCQVYSGKWWDRTNQEGKYSRTGGPVISCTPQQRSEHPDPHKAHRAQVGTPHPQGTGALRVAWCALYVGKDMWHEGGAWKVWADGVGTLADGIPSKGPARLLGNNVGSLFGGPRSCSRRQEQGYGHHCGAHPSWDCWARSAWVPGTRGP